jgi:hypothetical protein
MILPNRCGFKRFGLKDCHAYEMLPSHAIGDSK